MDASEADGVDELFVGIEVYGVEVVEVECFVVEGVELLGFVKLADEDRWQYSSKWLSTVRLAIGNSRKARLHGVLLASERAGEEVASCSVGALKDVRSAALEEQR